MSPPPRLADRLLRLFCAPYLREEVLGDLHERYILLVQAWGETNARRRYWREVLAYVRPSIIKRQLSEYPNPTTTDMLRNYIKIAWRNALTHKVASLINLAGLTLGLTGCLLITAYILEELSFDRFHQHADQIVLFQQNQNSPHSGGKFAADFKSRFAQVADAVRLTRLKPLVSYRQTAFYEPNFWLADSSVFNVFTLPLTSGNPKTALAEQYGVVLSQTVARKYFGRSNPVGQSIRFNNKVTLHVTGVLRELPVTSHLKIDFLASYINANELAGYDVTTNYWGGNDTWTYLLLAPGTVMADLTAQFPAYIKQLGDPNAAIWKLNLVPLTDIYLRTNLVASNRLTYVYVFGVVALLILGLACFNYVNLTTARATRRAKEVGIRKVMGSSFGQLWQQFMGETVGVLLLAVLLAIGLTVLVLPMFNALADKQLTIHSLMLGSRLIWLGVGLVVVALLAGGYPAFILSSFRPMAVLKGNGMLTGGRAWLRQILVVGQFTVSAGMIIATTVVYTQLQFVRTKDVGYSREQILTIDLHDASSEAKDHFETVDYNPAWG